MPHRAFVLVLAALLASPLHAQPLTLEEALRLGEHQSPRLAAQRHQRDAAREQIGRAAELPDPRLRMGVENLPVTGAERYRYDKDFMTMRSVGLMQEFPNQAKRRARGARAETLHALEQAAVVAQRAAVRRDIAAAWLEVHYGEKALGALERLAGQFQLQAGAVAAGVAQGRLPAAEHYVLRQAFEQAIDRGIEQRRAVDRSRIQLAVWLRSEAARPLGSPPDTSRLADSRERLLARLAEHPALQESEQREALARSEVEVASSGRKSDWSLEVSFAQREPEFTNMVSVMLSLELPWQAKYRQDRDVASRLAEVGQAGAALEDARRAREAELRGRLADFDTAQQRVERFERLLLPLARERVAATRAAYRGARGELGPALEAERSVTEAELGLVQSEAERARAWANLQFVYVPGDAQ